MKGVRYSLQMSHLRSEDPTSGAMSPAELCVVCSCGCFLVRFDGPTPLYPLPFPFSYQLAASHFHLLLPCKQWTAPFIFFFFLLLLLPLFKTQSSASESRFKTSLYL